MKSVMADNVKKFGYKVAIFDPTSIRGKEMKRVLIERNFPSQSVKLIDSREKLGTLTDFDDEATFIQLADAETLEESDVVFFCGKPAESRDLAAMHRKLDFFAFDLSRFMDESDEYRCFVNGVNCDSAADFNGIFAAPHPVSVLLTKVISKLHKAFGVKSAAATVMTSVSEEGFEGISSLHSQTTKLLSFASLDEKQRVFNIFPSAGLYPAEMLRISGEVEKLVSLKTGSFSLSLIEAPIFFGAAASIYVELDKAPGAAFSWQKLYSGKEDFRFDGNISKGDTPMGPVEIADTDMLHLQILSQDKNDGRRFWIWAIADNIRLCSVINLVQVAEKALKINGD
jgi:aspartate-semialdehyde dehydrogenase